MLFAAPCVVIRMPNLGVCLKEEIHEWTQLIHCSASIHPLPSSFHLFTYVWQQRTTCGNRFSPSIESGIELMSVLAASLHPPAEPSCLPGSGLFAFQTLALQLQTSHVLESRLNCHRLPPSDFQRHCFPCTVEEASSKCGGSHSVCLLLLLP